MKICPLLMRGRSKGELSYIKGAIARGDEDAISELFCLEELCAWYIKATEKCSIAVIAEAHAPIVINQAAELSLREVLEEYENQGK